jgi:hypothetical protein
MAIVKKTDKTSGEDTGEEEALIHCWLECKLLQPGGNQLKIELPCDPAIALPDIHPKQCKRAYNRDTCTSVFIVTQITIAQKWD